METSRIQEVRKERKETEKSIRTQEGNKHPGVYSSIYGTLTEGREWSVRVGETHIHSRRGLLLSIYRDCRIVCLCEVIYKTKNIFARNGIPETVVSGCGPQYTSGAYEQFSKNYQFRHVTNSPYFPQNNDEAERTVRTVKELLKK